MKNKHNLPSKMTKHHRKPSAQGGTDEPSNISMITKSKHDAWNIIIPNGNMTPADIAHEINKTYLDPAFELVAIRKSLN